MNQSLEHSASDAVPEVAALSYGHKTARGMMWSFGSIIIARIASFGALYVLGLILTEGDFSLFAMAAAMNALVSTFRDAGVIQILVRRRKEFDRLAQPAFKVALGFSFLSAATLVALTPLATRYSGMPGLPPLMYITAISIPLSTPSVIYSAKLSVQLRFKTLAKLAAASGIVRNASMAMFAVLGFGATSFVLPLLVVAVFDWVTYRWVTGGIPRGSQLDWPMFQEIFGASKWLMLGVLGNVLIGQGDKLTIPAFYDNEEDLAKVLGPYFFGFQLTFAIYRMFSSGMLRVLMPSLARLTDDVPRQGRAYVKATRLLVFGAAPGCIGLSAVADPTIHLLWGNKWASAIFVVQIMSVSLILRLLTPLAVSLAESRGAWRLRAAMLWGDAAATVLATAIGAYLGGLMSIVICISIQRMIAGLLQCLSAGWLVGLSPGVLFGTMWPSLLTCGVIGSMSYAMFTHIIPVSHYGVQCLAIGGTFIVLFGVASTTVLQSPCREVLSLVRKRRDPD